MVRFIPLIIVLCVYFFFNDRIGQNVSERIYRDELTRMHYTCREVIEELQDYSYGDCMENLTSSLK